ncbi:AmmeMemoRadiSam system protein B [Bacteroidota bacterium]
MFLIIVSTAASQNVRPARDEIGFCWNAEEMSTFIEYLQTNYDEESNYSHKNLVAGIVPHDDFLYSGRISFPLFKLIKTKEVVIFGVTHGAVRRAVGDPQNILILDNFDQWTGPYGNINISSLREIVKRKLDSDYYIVNDNAQMLEHSIGSLLPYLQHYNPKIKITSIMVTKVSFDRMEEISDQLSKIISEYIASNDLEFGEDIFFLFSNDANHYGDDFNNSPYGIDAAAHKKATDNDRRIAKECFAGVINKDKIVKFTEELWPELGKSDYPPLWCGRYPITFGLLTTTKVIQLLTSGSLTGQIFGYSDTFTEQVLPVKGTSMGITAPFSLKHWVGFLSVGFYTD